MTGDSIRAHVLSVQIIPAVDAGLAKKMALSPEIRSIGLVTCDSDDVGYAAVDEATKQAAVEVVYARSMYAGAANASTALAGEFLGILGGANVQDVKSGVQHAVHYIENEAHFVSANDEDSVVYFAHCISRTGTYLSKAANVEEGASIAYLIAPPLESVYALDQALKAADVRVAVLYGPPSETNFGGGLLTGSQAACKAACEAFARAVEEVAAHPREEFPLPAGKREYETSLDGGRLVIKNHPRIVLRGKLDSALASILQIQLDAKESGNGELYGELSEMAELIKKLVGADFTGKPIGETQLFGYDAELLRQTSHSPQTFGFSGHIMPGPEHGREFVSLNKLRTELREVELAAVAAYEGELDERIDILTALNRLSSAAYILCLKYARK